MQRYSMLAGWLAVFLIFGVSHARAQVYHVACLMNDDGNLVCESSNAGTVKFMNMTHLGIRFATKEDLDEAIAGIVRGDLPDIFSVIDKDLAQKSFLFGFFAIFSVWIIGFAIGTSRKLLFYLSK